MRRGFWILAGIALVAVLVIGLTQAGGTGAGNDGAGAKRFDLGTAKRKLAGAPKPLASLYARANELLGGPAAMERRLLALRGHPVVVNKWASWCRPCRAEFPIFQRVTLARGTTVAFVGLNGKDKVPAARSFLAREPLPYPSYQDPDEVVAGRLKVPGFYPETVFLDAHGRTQFIHTGEYTSEAQLTRDIDRYLG
jgi:thiol-disulfide isomerase/thioredoxin